MNIREIVELYIKQNQNIDGLVDRDGECKCMPPDLAPCRFAFEDCETGHREPCTCEKGHKYHIVPELEEKTNV